VFVNYARVQLASDSAAAVDETSSPHIEWDDRNQDTWLAIGRHILANAECENEKFSSTFIVTVITCAPDVVLQHNIST
jgi:hypothetical protein